MKVDTITLLEGFLTAAFVGTWIVLGIVGVIVFYLGKDVAFKRKWFPRYIILGGVLFVLFATTLSVLESRSLWALGILIPAVPMVVLISYLNLKYTKFCSNCGTTIHEFNWFSSLKFCSKCGAELDAKPDRADDLL